MNAEWAEWDSAETLRTPEEISAFLNAVLDLNDPAILPDAIGAIARSRGMSSVAKEAGLGRESLYKSLSNGGNPRLSTLVKVLEVLGLRLQVAPI